MAVLFTATNIDVSLSQPGFWQSLIGPEGGVVQCFAVDNNENTLAGTYFGGVYKTTDRGTSWFQLPYINLDIRALAVNPNGTIFLGAVTSGLWKSSDNGATWVRPTNILNGRTVTSIAFHSSGNVIAACISTSSQAVFQSTDNGETFFHVSSGVLSGNSVIRQGTDMYFAGDRNGVLRSTDGGFLWSTINPSTGQFNGLSLTANASYVYVVGRRTAATNPDSSFIYRRSLSSGNWELVHIQSRTILRTISSVGDTLIAAGDSTVLVSFNGGQNWIDRSSVTRGDGPQFYGWWRSLAAQGYRDYQLVGLSGQGVVRSTDFFDTWEKSTEGMYNTHIVARPLIWGDKMFISTQFNGRWKYNFTTITWDRTGAGLPVDDVVSSLAADNTNMYAGTPNNGLWRSNDWGETFSQNLSGTNATGFADIYTSPSIAGFVLAGGRGERLWKTTNSGDMWISSLLPGSPFSIVGVEAVNPDEIFVATGNFAGYGSGQGVKKTTNGGTVWNQWGLQFTSAVGFDLASDGSLLFGAANEQVFEGNRSVPTWTAAPSLPLGAELRDIRYAGEFSGFRVAAATSYALHDRPASTPDPWIERPVGGYEVSRIEVVRAPAGPTFSGQIIAGTYGGGVYLSTAPLTSAGESAGIPDAFVLEQNYPNPFNPGTRIVYRVVSRELVSLKVFDVLGSEVVTLVNEVKAPGEYSVAFDGSSLSSGVYFYRLDAGQFVSMKKLVLLR